jgi:hypothetical protein
MKLLIYSRVIIAMKFTYGLANFYSKILALNFTTLWKYYLIDFKSADSAQFVSETYWREVWQTSKGRLFIAHLTIAHEA